MTRSSAVVPSGEGGSAGAWHLLFTIESLGCHDFLTVSTYAIPPPMTPFFVLFWREEMINRICGIFGANSRTCPECPNSMWGWGVIAWNCQAPITFSEAPACRRCNTPAPCTAAKVQIGRGPHAPARSRQGRQRGEWGRKGEGEGGAGQERDMRQKERAAAQAYFHSNGAATVARSIYEAAATALLL